jgi:hypothetical protein
MTKVERKIASSETIPVSSPYGSSSQKEVVVAIGLGERYAADSSQ